MLICSFIICLFWISGSAIWVNKVSWFLNLSATEVRNVKKWPGQHCQCDQQKETYSTERQTRVLAIGKKSIGHFWRVTSVLKNLLICANFDVAIVLLYFSPFLYIVVVFLLLLRFVICFGGLCRRSSASCPLCLCPNSSVLLDTTCWPQAAEAVQH